MAQPYYTQLTLWRLLNVALAYAHKYYDDKHHCATQYPIGSGISVFSLYIVYKGKSYEDTKDLRPVQADGRGNKEVNEKS